MLVVKVKRLKEETLSFSEMRDIEDLVVETMGEDVWLSILTFTQNKVEELEEEISSLKDDNKSCDNSTYDLRTGVRDEIEFIEKLITKINDAKRLDRRMIIQELNGIKHRLSDNEGYF